MNFYKIIYTIFTSVKTIRLIWKELIQSYVFHFYGYWKYEYISQ